MHVLYCAGGGVGNVVMATPAMRALRDLGHEVTCFVQPEDTLACGLLDGWSALERVIPGELPVPGRYDLAIHSVWSLRRGLHERELVPGKVEYNGRHESEINMEPVRHLGVRQIGFAADTPDTHVEIEVPDALGTGPYYVLGPGCKIDGLWQRKRWGDWIGLQALLGEARCIFLGAREDSRHWMASDLCGAETLRRAAGIISRARCYVGIDNGLAHVAASLRVPTVVMFGATSEKKSRPLGRRVKILTRRLDCRPCQGKDDWDACMVWRCMDFDPEEVADAVREMS